ncbi:putative zinc-containing alcohol dehydrogenase [Aspergillus lucknowensis]|uniref:Alcohol dehydrogenase n=1 Tax=Aspergillus lucknowensis TaxID=176173 RepID=A0ABR4LIC2_9EURO
MKALVYQGPNCLALEERPKPSIQDPTDAIVKVTHTTICGTDIHLLQNEIPCNPDCILGHEGVGIIEAIGSGVTNFYPDQLVLISCITSCGYCLHCRKGMPSNCLSGGFTLGNKIDGTQAEYVRVPHASFSLHLLPDTIDRKASVLLSDVFPTAYECGIRNGQIRPGSRVAIIGPGPIGLAALSMLKSLFGPALVVVIGRGKSRLDAAKAAGADHTLSTLDGIGELTERSNALTGDRGFDVVIEAVGSKQAFEISQALVAAGGTIATLGVYGSKCDLHLEKLWNRNICLKTGLVDTVSTPELLEMAKAGILRPESLVSHNFSLDEIEQAYTVVRAASEHGTMKVVITI